MNQFLPPLLVCALLLPLEASLLPFVQTLAGGLPFGTGVGAGAELPLCAVVLLAVGSASTLEGAFGCFLFGALADLTYRVQPGLFTLADLLLFVLLRLGPAWRTPPGPLPFAALCALAVPLQGVLLCGLLWLIGHPLPESPLPVFAAGALSTALAAPLFHWLCAQVTGVLVRDDPSLLR